MKTRRNQALQTRQQAADLAANRPHPRHLANGDELRYRRDYGNPELPNGGAGLPSYIASFTKGLPHELGTGWLLDPRDFAQFVQAMDQSQASIIADLRLGPVDYDPKSPVWQSQMAQNVKNAVAVGNKGRGAGLRAWESMSAGLAFDLEGPDAQAVTMPPAPELCSDEMAAEVTELYLQALLRDVPFEELEEVAQNFDLQSVYEKYREPAPDVRPSSLPSTKVNLVELLAKMPWFNNNQPDCTYTEGECKRRRPITPERIFRGITRGNEVGPYLSQFLLIGTPSLGGSLGIEDGHIQYGAITIDQRVRDVKNVDFMTTWEQFIDVQNAANLVGLEEYEPTNNSNNTKGFRFISSPRDLATYVHVDALYEAYLNAALILLGLRTPFDPGIPFGEVDFRDKQQGFANFGGPHILSLVTEVATRALKAVRYQKFNVHRRLRPEAVGGLFDRFFTSEQDAKPMKWLAEQMPEELWPLVVAHNAVENQRLDRNLDPSANCNRYLLPMAFAEGSPMHPTYGAGHATVAGACVTVLKAWFDHGTPLTRDGKGFAFVPRASGRSLVDRAASFRNPKFGDTLDKCPLTVEGELNKLASNISIGRNWGGVHYFSDYYESICMGEQIALGILEEQKLTFGENFSMTVPLFDGSVVRI